MSTKNRTRRTTTRNIAFLTKWLNKLTSLLSKKGPGISQPGSLKPAVGDQRPEKRAYTSIKSDEEWTSRVLPHEQDDIVNSLNYEGIAVIELQFYHFLTMTDCVLALSQTKWIWMRLTPVWWSVNHQGIILHIIMTASALPRIAHECFQRRTLCSIHTVQHQGNSWNGAIKHIFYTNQITEDHRQIVLYSFCRSMRLLFI